MTGFGHDLTVYAAMFYLSSYCFSESRIMNATFLRYPVKSSLISESLRLWS